MVNKQRQTSVLVQYDSVDRYMVKKKRAYLKVNVESILDTTQQNIAQTGHSEDRSNNGHQSDINRGNLIELLYICCRDIPRLADRLNSQLEAHH